MTASIPRTVTVNDANIFIDLHKTALLATFFELPFDFRTTRVVLRELLAEQREAVEAYEQRGILMVREYEWREIEALGTEAGLSRSLSIQDISVFVYAREVNGMILTADNKLRKEASRRDIEVHGMVWIFEELVRGGKLSRDQATERVELLLRVNPFAPVKECEALIKRWQGQD